jgi:hypothetical protein
VKVLNDDPAPKVTLTPSASVVAGGTLTWHASLSAAVDSDVYLEGQIVAPTTGPELTTTDVDPAWLKSMGADPLPSRPLSTVPFLEVFQRVAAGSTDVDLTLPTLAHTPPDPDKHVQLHVLSYPPELGVDLTVTGTVTGK